MSIVLHREIIHTSKMYCILFTFNICLYYYIILPQL